MDWIDEATVEETWQEIAAYGLDQARSEMTDLGRLQPDLLAFVVVSSDELSEEARELAVYLFFVVYSVFQRAYDQELPRVSAQQLMQQDDRTEEFIMSLQEADEDAMESAALQETARQPWVMNYIVEALVEAPQGETPVDLSEDEFGNIFLVLKTVVDALDEATNAAA